MVDIVEFGDAKLVALNLLITSYNIFDTRQMLGQ